MGIEKIGIKQFNVVEPDVLIRLLEPIKQQFY